MGDAKADDTFVSAERLLGEHQVDFDIAGEDAIGSQLKIGAGTFVSGSGNRYKTVIVPRAALLPEAVVARLKSFAKSGGHVVFLGALPEFAGGRNDLHARKVGADAFAWATLIAGELPVTPIPPAQPPTSAPEAMAVPQGFVEALDRALPANDVKLESPNTALRVMHRKWADAMVVLLFNESGTALEDKLLLGKAARVEVWDPQSGRSLPAQILHEGSKATLPLTLAPYATEVVVLR